MSRLATLLHRPLSLPFAISLEGAATWLASGLRLALPRRVRHLGWRPSYQVVSNRSASGPSECMIERSWCGELRKRSSGMPADAPIGLALAECNYFETELDLPAAAARDLDSAARLRLDGLSPLPLDQVDYALGAPTKSASGRLNVPIAFARKRTLDEAARNPRTLLIGARLMGDGAFAFLFRKRRSGIGSQSSALAVAALAAGLVLLLAGVEAYLDRQIAAAEADQAALFSALRAHKEMAAYLEEPPSAVKPGLTTSETASALDRISAALPRGARLVLASYAGKSWSLKGFAPEDAIWPEELAPTLSPSRRPAFDAFTLELEASE